MRVVIRYNTDTMLDTKTVHGLSQTPRAKRFSLQAVTSG